MSEGEVAPSETTRRGAPLKYGPDRFTSRQRGLKIRDRTKIYLLQAFEEWKTVKKLFDIASGKTVTNGEFANHLLGVHRTSGCETCGLDSVRLVSSRKYHYPFEFPEMPRNRDRRGGSRYLEHPCTTCGDYLCICQKVVKSSQSTAKTSSSKRKQKHPKSIRKTYTYKKNNRPLVKGKNTVVEVENSHQVKNSVPKKKDVDDEEEEFEEEDHPEPEGNKDEEELSEEEEEEEEPLFTESDVSEEGKVSSDYEPSEKGSSEDDLSNSEPEPDDLLNSEEERKRKLRLKGVDPDNLEPRPIKRKRGPGRIIRRVKWAEILKTYQCKLCSFRSEEIRGMCVHLIGSHSDITTDLMSYVKKTTVEEALKHADKEANWHDTVPERKQKKSDQIKKEQSKREAERLEAIQALDEDYRNKTLYDLIKEEVESLMTIPETNKEEETALLEEEKKRQSRMKAFSDLIHGTLQEDLMNSQGMRKSNEVAVPRTDTIPGFEKTFNMYSALHAGHNSTTQSLMSQMTPLPPGGIPPLSHYGMGMPMASMGMSLNPEGHMMPSMHGAPVFPGSFPTSGVQTSHTDHITSHHNGPSYPPFNTSGHFVPRSMQDMALQRKLMEEHESIVQDLSSHRMTPNPNGHQFQLTTQPPTAQPLSHPSFQPTTPESSVASSVPLTTYSGEGPTEPLGDPPLAEPPLTEQNALPVDSGTVDSTPVKTEASKDDEEPQKELEATQEESEKEGDKEEDIDEHKGEDEPIKINLDPFESREVVILVERWIKMTLQCPYCNIKIKFMKKNDMHRCKRVLPSVLCDVCGKDFPQSYFRFHYRRVHMEQSTTVCQYCGKEMRPASLPRHIRLIHKPHTVFACGICKKEFNSKKHRDKHEAIHSKEKPFKCPTCNRGFTQRTNMKNHMRQHTGEQPYKCHNCMKSFTHNVSLKNHLKRYHGIDLWQMGHTGGGRPKKNE